MAVRDVSAGVRAKDAIQAEIRGGAEVDVLELDLSSMASVRRFAAEFASLNLPLNILMAKDAIQAEIRGGAEVDVLELDLSSMASVRRFAAEFASLNLPLNILINNAGVMARDCTRSPDGLELHFATNHIGTPKLSAGCSCGHFLLTNLLLENMKSACRDSGVEGRIVNVSSSGHIMTYPEGICFDKVHDPSGFNSFIAYGQSKLANILHMNELSRILKDEGVNISANTVHPGVIVTSLFRNRTIVSALMNTVGRIISRSVQQGAATTCYVAMHPQVQGITGKYFGNCNIANTSSQAVDAELAKKLSNFSLQIVSS
ncbi:Retinol dehydrogenase 14 [Triticum urartu]|uniref:Retinol dehydrogenase 14 n=1 Tax=Triticum urartu TaxID=4572 RepID=M7ZB92_TRIUA|nr:Retinol dehydrogenase 14 [Triticum urartu]